MRASRFFIYTNKEAPVEAEIISHQLMLRANFIKKAASGIYSWLPMGWRVVKKITDIVREEMEAAGAAEVFMPTVQPTDLWEESGRLQGYGKELLRFDDRHNRQFCLGPTHEEVITDIVRTYVSGYRQLPFNLFQIQTKFRDEIRPRFGIMRAREFIMKDAYSFDADIDGMKESYDVMRRAYCRIFDRIGLKYRMVTASSGAIGGDYSHEFMVLADSGEELILYCEESGFAANVEHCACLPPEDLSSPSPLQTICKIHTPNVKTIAALSEFMQGMIEATQNLKTMIVRGDLGMAAILLCGKHQLNLDKVSRHPYVGNHVEFVAEEEVRALVGAGFGSLGPVNMPLPMIADYGLKGVNNFICGANEDDYHFMGVNFGRDCHWPDFADLRNAEAGDRSPCGKGILKTTRGIEVGHIFQLGDKYSTAMKAVVNHADGQEKAILMGCYGIGVTRIAAAAIEQGHDDYGIIFPDAIAPFHLLIVAIGTSPQVLEQSEKLYALCLQKGLDVLLDDRNLRPGVMFSEADLVGIPHRITIGDRGLKNNEVEYKHRCAKERENIPIENVEAWLSGLADSILPR